MGDELSCGQARDWHTHTRTHRPTDAGDDNTRRPKLASGKNCDDAGPRYFVRLDSIWEFCVFVANSEGPVGSPTACKNKRPRPVAVLIPGNNIWKSAMTQFLVILGGFSENRFLALTRFSGCRIWGVLPSSPTACRDLVETSWFCAVILIAWCVDLPIILRVHAIKVSCTYSIYIVIT